MKLVDPAGEAVDLGDFRALLSAAPLKLSGLEAIQSQLEDFRALLSAAPLKLLPEPMVSAKAPGFPRSLERGSIEAVYPVPTPSA